MTTTSNIISTVATFTLVDQSQKGERSVESTFSKLNSSIENVNKNGNQLLLTVSQVNDKIKDINTISPIEVTINVPKKVLEMVGNVNTKQFEKNTNEDTKNTAKKIIDYGLAALIGAMIGVISLVVGALLAPFIVPVTVATAAAALISGALTAIITKFMEDLEKNVEDNNNLINEINFGNFGDPNGFLNNIKRRNEIIEAALKTEFARSDKELAEIAFQIEQGSGRQIDFQEILRVRFPEAELFFKPERIERINKLLQEQRDELKKTQEAIDSLNKSPVGDFDIFEEGFFSKNFGIEIEEAENSLKDLEIFKNGLFPDEIGAFLEPLIFRINTDDVDNAKDKLEEFEDVVEEGQQGAIDYNDTFGLLNGSVAALGDGLIKGAGAQEQYLIAAGKSAEEIENQVKQASKLDSETQNLVAQNKNLTQSQTQTTEAMKDGAEAAANAGESTKQLAEDTRSAAESIVGLQVFAADVAANINDAFADLIFNSLKGNFDDLSDIWDATMDAMLESFSQFLATGISNPIRLQLEAFLTGDSSKVPKDGLGGNGNGNGGGGGYKLESVHEESGWGNVIQLRKKHNLCSNHQEYRLAA